MRFPFSDHVPPMPLKHFTETFLIIALAVAIALTGLLTATLPPLPDGAIPWAVLFAFFLIYPLFLNPLFQRRRADNMFRILHWFPAAMLLLWLVAQGVALSDQPGVDLRSLTWAWTLVPVLLGFFLLIVYCLKVIRRRRPRIALIALLLVPFTAAALVSEQGSHFEKDLANALWSADFWNVETFPGWREVARVEDEANLEPSEDRGEESWRERLRMQKRREARIAGRIYSGEERSQQMSSALSRAQSAASRGDMLSGTGEELRAASTMPAKLPSSGFEWGIIVVTMLAGYCGTVHRKTVRRIMEN